MSQLHHLRQFVGTVALAAAVLPMAHSAAVADAPATELVLLGTAAGPVPRVERSQPATLLRVGEQRYLIDAGNGVVRQLARLGLSASDVRTVFLTHHHLDHNADVSALMGFAWLDDAKRNRSSLPPLRFYGPAGTRELVDAGLRYLAVTERIFRSAVPMPPLAGRVQAFDVAPQGVIFEDAQLRVRVAENTHFAHTAGTADRSYSYRFEMPGRTVVLCGDSGPSEALAELARGADDLVCEVNALDATLRAMGAATMPPPFRAALRQHMSEHHMTPEELGKLAQRAGVKRVILTHVSPGLDGETDPMLYTAGVSQFFSGPVVLGHDLQRL